MTFDVFEFPKQVVLWTVALILLVLWFARMVTEGELRLVRTPIDLPLLVLVGVTALATILSATRYTSLVGFFGRPDGGLAALLAYTIIFYAAASNLRSIKDVLQVSTAFLASNAVIAVLLIAYFFGFFVFPFAGTATRTFSPAGGVYNAALLLALAAPIALGILLYMRRATEPAVQLADTGDQKPATKVSLAPLYSALLTVATLLYLAAVIVVGTLGAVVAAAVGIAVLLLWSKRSELRSATPYILAILLAVGFWALLTKVSYIKDQIPGLKEPLPAQETLDVRQAWTVAGNTVTDFPFFGSGPGTFMFDYTRYRSSDYNLADTWNVRFLVSHDQYLQLLTTTGVFGLFAYLFMLFRLALYGFRTALTNRASSAFSLRVAMFAAILAFIIGTLLVVPSTVTMFAFFLLLALFFTLEKNENGMQVSERKLAFVLNMPMQSDTSGMQPGTRSKVSPASLVFVLPLLLIVLAVFYFMTQYVRANYYYVAGVQMLGSNKPNAAGEGLVLLEKAAQTNPWEDGYHRDLARSAFQVALALSQKQDITDQDRQVVSRLLERSIGEAQRAVTLSPVNVNNWQTLADIYRRLALQIQGAGDVALQAYAQAIRQDPPNPQLYLDAGGIFYAANAYERAIDAFKQAVLLKPNLANAHYNLANAYAKKGEYDQAMAEYQAAQQLVSQLPDSDQSKKQSIDQLKAEMDAIKDKVSTRSAQPAGAQASPAPTASPVATPATSPRATPRAIR